MLNGARRRDRTVQGGDRGGFMRKGSKEKDGRDAPSPRRRRAGVARAAPSGHAQREHVVEVSVGRATSACRTRSTSRLRRGMAPPATRGPLDTSAKIDPSRQRPDRARARAPMTASMCAQGTRMRMQDPCHQGRPVINHPWSTYRRSDRASSDDRTISENATVQKLFQHARVAVSRKPRVGQCRSKATSTKIDRNFLSTSRLFEGERLQISSQLSAKK